MQKDFFCWLQGYYITLSLMYACIITNPLIITVTIGMAVFGFVAMKSDGYFFLHEYTNNQVCNLLYNSLTPS